MNNWIVRMGLLLLALGALQACSQTEQDDALAADSNAAHGEETQEVAQEVEVVAAEMEDGVPWPYTSVMDIMVEVITPATNTLWGVYEPPETEEDWKALEDASQVVVDAANQIARGGSGPQDDEWAANPAYQAMNQAMKNAGQASLEAARARDLDKLIEIGGDALYTPCEACHLQFNPGVVGQ